MLTWQWFVHYSVLIHALPGMALFAHRYAPVPSAVLEGIARVSPATARWAALPSSAPVETSLLWTFATPLAFYGAWQLMYFLVVQVSCRHRMHPFPVPSFLLCASLMCFEQIAPSCPERDYA